MPHQITTDEILPSLNAETVLASSTKEEKQLLMVTSTTKWQSIQVKFRVAQKGAIKPFQPLTLIGCDSEVVHEGKDGAMRHYWDFRFLENAVNHYNEIS